MALFDYLSERGAAAMPPSSRNVASVAHAENADATPKPAPHKDVASVASVAPEKTKVQNTFESAADQAAADQLPPPMTDAEHAAVMGWLAFIDEDDPAIVAEVLDLCRTDHGAREYYLRRSLEVPTADDMPADDRRTCRQCARLASSGRCRAPFIEGADLPIGALMRADLPKRCLGFSPLEADPDQRPATQRWPGLR